jgi:hypothetical protein
LHIVKVTESVFDWLQGEFSFVREIPGYASVRGKARITATGNDAARYEETAVVSLVQGGRLRATQCYLSRRLPAPLNGMEVFFCETGELFERLEFGVRTDGSLEARARFLCAADAYESTFAVDPQGLLRVEHTVRGPRKNYRVETLYTRIAKAG